MGELMRLIRAHDIRAAQVEKIDVGGNHGMTTSLHHHRPTTGLQAKFSMEFCLAILLLERKAGLAEFTDAVVQRADVQALIRRINFFVAPEAEQAGLDKMTSLLRVQLKTAEGAHRAGRVRQGQSVQSDELRRGGRQVPRLRTSLPAGRRRRRRPSSRR